MFEQAVQTSEALRQAARQAHRALIPTLLACPACQTARMIAAPVIGSCPACGAETTVLSSAETWPAQAREPLTRAA